MSVSTSLLILSASLSMSRPSRVLTQAGSHGKGGNFGHTTATETWPSGKKPLPQFNEALLQSGPSWHSLLKLRAPRPATWPTPPWSLSCLLAGCEVSAGLSTPHVAPPEGSREGTSLRQRDIGPSAQLPAANWSSSAPVKFGSRAPSCATNCFHPVKYRFREWICESPTSIVSNLRSPFSLAQHVFFLSPSIYKHAENEHPTTKNAG